MNRLLKLELKENNMNFDISLIEDRLLKIKAKQKEDLDLIEEATNLIDHYMRIFINYEEGYLINMFIYVSKTDGTPKTEPEEMVDTGFDYTKLYLEDLESLIKNKVKELNKRGFPLMIENDF